MDITDPDPRKSLLVNAKQFKKKTFLPTDLAVNCSMAGHKQLTIHDVYLYITL